MIDLHADWDGAAAAGERTLVLLHGFTGDTTTWDPVRAGLRRWGKTLALDLVGHGKSPKPDDIASYKMDACVDQVLAALDRRNILSAWFVGYSMGGRVALTIAAHHPERVAGLILESASPGLEDAQARAARAAEDTDLAEGITAWGIPVFVEQWLEKPMFSDLKDLSPEQQAVQRLQRLRNNPVGLANSLRGMGTGSMEPVWDALGGLRMPVLILAGRKDAKFVETAKRMQALLSHAQLHLYPASGHTPHATEPNQWMQPVDAFFQSL
ncbi:MAG: 2-succinyl-6-hydroxy-2,4-cyclohexadiene-1-carboxylate synthase [SAR324 cluster bacterium]